MNKIIEKEMDKMNQNSLYITKQLNEEQENQTLPFNCVVEIEDDELTDDDIVRFKEGLTLGDGTECLEAYVRVLEKGETNLAEIKICEGKYHQVKRMFASIGNKVLALRRVKMGGLKLDPNLAEGECREITAEEFELLLAKE